MQKHVPNPCVIIICDIGVLYSQEINRLKEEVKTKSSDIDEKLITINQVRLSVLPVNDNIYMQYGTDTLSILCS